MDLRCTEADKWLDFLSVTSSSKLGPDGNFKLAYNTFFTSTLIKTSCDELSHVHIVWTISDPITGTFE